MVLVTRARQKLKNAVRRSARAVAARRYTPRGLRPPGDSTPPVKLYYALLPGAEGVPVARIVKGRLYTDGSCNITCMAGLLVVPEVSWQFDTDHECPPEAICLLTGEQRITTSPRYIKGTVVSLLSGGGAMTNYFHWLCDVLSRVSLTREVLDPAEGPPTYLIPNDRYGFQYAALSVYGVDPGSCITSVTHQHIVADQLIATGHPNSDQNAVTPWIVHDLREKFLPTSSGRPFPPLVYISRGDSLNLRRMTNEARFIKALEAAGFVSYRLSELSLPDQVSLFVGSKVIVGVHGAGFTNLAFCKPGTHVFELFADVYGPRVFQSISNTLGLRYSRLEFPAVDSNDPLKASFEVDPSQIEKIVGLARSIGGA